MLEVSVCAAWKKETGGEEEEEEEEEEGVRVRSLDAIAERENLRRPKSKKARMHACLLLTQAEVREE